MDCSKVGELICRLRRESGMTQKQLAQRMNISDKTVSKWERGQGCPDVSLLRELSKALSVNVEQILSGDLEQSGADGGNMKRIKFYVCPSCGNVMTATGGGELSCCGRKLSPLAPRQADGDHQIQVQEVENDYYLTFSHEMAKEHYLSFVAYVTWDRVLLVKLYPEQSGEVRFPRMRPGTLYSYCSRDGLWNNGPVRQTALCAALRD